MSIFSSKKPVTDAFDTLIASTISIEGNILYSGVVCIKGAVKGDYISCLEADSTLRLDRTSRVDVNTMAGANFIIDSALSDVEILATGLVRIEAGSALTNVKIFAGNYEIAKGAQLKNVTFMGPMAEGVAKEPANGAA